MKKEEEIEIDYLKQNYELIKKYSKPSKIIYKDFSQEIIKNNFENLNQNEFLEKIFFLVFSIYRQIELLIFSNKGHEVNIFKAIINDDIESVKFLIENNFYSISDVNDEGKSVLSYGLECHNENIYNYLLSKQTIIEFQPITEKPKDFDSNLFRACKKGKLTSVQWLIEKEGINKNEKDKYNDAPIHIASKNGHLSIVQYLIEKQNVYKDIVGRYGKTPLHYACQKGHFNVVEYLISKGADIDAKDEDEWGLLHYASFNGRTDIVQYLVSKGANKNTKSKSGRTPYDLAKKEEIRNILE